MKLTIELPDWIAAELSAAPLPPELVGPSVEERLIWLADDAALRLQEVRKSAELHKLFGVLDLDDEIPF